MKHLLLALCAAATLSTNAQTGHDTLDHTLSIFVERPLYEGGSWLQLNGFQYEGWKQGARRTRVFAALGDLRNSGGYLGTRNWDRYEVYHTAIMGVVGAALLWEKDWKHAGLYAGPELRVGAGGGQTSFYYPGYYTDKGDYGPAFYGGICALAGAKYLLGNWVLSAELSSVMHFSMSRRTNYDDRKYWDGIGTFGIGDFNTRIGVGYRF